MRRTIRKRKGGALPQQFDISHDLCFVIHDILAQFITSGMKAGVFKKKLQFKDEFEAKSFEAHESVLDWLESVGRLEDRASLLKTVVLPAVLSDLLHCVYEALESSRKGKLNVTYILLRKPLQESLFLLEAIVIDQLDFSDKLSTFPLKLRPKTAGGVEGHSNRIMSVLRLIGEMKRYDGSYLAQLRYSKDTDGFDGICNHAIHLFTEHEAIRTEALNINFIFSNWDDKLSQWAYLYSRLPYVLTYLMRLIDHLGDELFPTPPQYSDDMTRRVSALIVLHEQEISEDYQKQPLTRFIEGTYQTLVTHCEMQNCRVPTQKDLERMAACGALPGESVKSVKARRLMFEEQASSNREKPL